MGGMMETGAAKEEGIANMVNIAVELKDLRGIVDVIRTTLGLDTMESKHAERKPSGPVVALALEREIGTACEEIRRVISLLKDVVVATKRLRMAILIE